MIFDDIYFGKLALCIVGVIFPFFSWASLAPVSVGYRRGIWHLARVSEIFFYPLLLHVYVLMSMAARIQADFARI